MTSSLENKNMTGFDGFSAMAKRIADEIDQHDLNDDPEALISQLNEKFGDAEFLNKLQDVVLLGEKSGWCLQHEANDVKFSRPIKANTSAGIYSVDVVEMENLEGPYHAHPNGEIGVILAIEGQPKFDDFDLPWYVHAPGSQHYPTVSGGRAHVLYWLPHGKIDFSVKPN